LVNKYALDGRRIVLTGAAGDFGAAACEELRRCGAAVVGIDARAADGVLRADVTEAAEVREVMAAAGVRLGGIDTLVNCAGIGVPQDAGDFPDADAHRVMEVNFFGAWNATAAAMPLLLASGRGHVVNILSGLALVDFPYAAAYSASKRALDAYSNILRLEYPGRLTVTKLYPGYVRTAIHRRSIELNAGLEGLTRAETLSAAAAAMVRACAVRPRSGALTRRSAFEYWLSRHWPSLVERVLATRVRTALANRPRPTFLRYPEV
jgi:NAD(P)-dependent dehydrogenase (short-subunit alcohol dehydrogenase family)